MKTERIHEETLALLHEIGNHGETFDQIIMKAAEHYKKCKKK
jgi:hypothetical protein